MARILRSTDGGNALCTLLLTFAFASSCATKKAEEAPAYPLPAVEAEGEPVAQVGPVKLTSKELEKRINALNPFQRERMSDLGRRREFVDHEVRFEMLAQEAWRRGLYRDPWVVGEMKKALVQKLVRDELERQADANVTADDLRAAFEARKDELNKPERIRAAQIVRSVRSDAERKAAKQQLERLKAEIQKAEKRDPNAFAELAAKHSDDEGTKSAGGDLQFLTRKELAERWGEDIAKGLFETAQVGDLAVVDAANAVVLFKKTGLRHAVTRSLESVAPQLKAQVAREKRNQSLEKMLEDMKRERGITLSDAALEKIQIDLKAPTGGGAPAVPAAHEPEDPKP